MSDHLRVLNEAGIAQFSEYLARLRSGAKEAPPFALLTDENTSIEAPGEVVLDRRTFSNPFEFGTYLSAALEPLDRREISYNHALWTWLALYFFEQICPADATGARAPLEDAVYILQKKFNHQRYYRHLVRTPWLAVLEHGPNARVLLITTGRGSRSDIFEQLVSRQGIFGNATVIAGAQLLYYDPVTARPKRGAGGKGAGSPRRLVSVIQQLDLTYDLRTCTVDQFLTLLPAEFDKFKRAS
jgi:hypothetical protein